MALAHPARELRLAPCTRSSGQIRAIAVPKSAPGLVAVVAPRAGAGAGGRSVLCQARRRFQGNASDGKQQPDVATPALVAESEAAAAVHAVEPVAQQVAALEALLARLGAVATYADKLSILRSVPAVKSFFATREGTTVARQLLQLSPKEAYTLVCLPAIGQAHVLGVIPTGIVLNEAFERLAGALARVEDFYDSIGGLVGYQLQCLRLIEEQRQQQQQQQQQQPASGSTSSTSSSFPPSSSSSRPSTSASTAFSGSTQYLVPCGLDLASSDPAQAAQARAATAAGIQALPQMAEIYPLGGAGDRLGLACEDTGESLPTAVLQYCGRSLLENLVRDLQAREYLYWHLHGQQHTTPLAVMTSAAKGNHWRVQQLFEANGWFGRGREAFRLFQQPLVPMVCGDDGRWLLSKPLQVLMKPGGHGVIWKLMIDEGVFSWLQEQGRSAALVRQISNPIAGTDTTLLALAGAGFPRRRAFGFASCDRVVGAAEGVNVLAEEVVRLPHTASSSSSSSIDCEAVGASPAAASSADGSCAALQYRYRITNVEYTEFERLGISDSSVDEESNHSVFPANTNVLYVGLQAAERTVRASMAASSTEAILPGMILNLGKKVRYHDAWLGAEREVAAGRLECTMQNLADCLGQAFDAPLESEEHKAGLDTFLVYNQRRKVTSSAKRKLQPGSTRISQTPDGSFYSLQQNAAELLARCGVAAPELGGVREYLLRGPGFIFLFHPALGPLWEVIAQKIRGGSLAERSEVQLEVAEACWEDVHVQGSLLVRAATPLGHLEQRPQQQHQRQQRHAAQSSGASSTGSVASTAASSSGPALQQQQPSQQQPSQHQQAQSQAAAADAFSAFAPGTANNHHLRGLWRGASSSAGSVAGRDEPSQDPAYSQPCTGVSHLDAQAAACATEEGLPHLVYSAAAGRVRLHNVRVVNRGIDWASKHNVYWRHKVARHEACRVLLRGRSEFEARDVALEGDLAFEVPDGYRMTVSATPDGRWKAELTPLAPSDPPSWQWRYLLQADHTVRLTLEESRVALGGPSAPASASADSWARSWPERNQTSSEDMYFI